jgi:serine/threonine protein phosphatase 1
MNSRTIAIGDIHGCSAALDALLEAIRPRPEDIIVTLGDYINRGPDSRGVLDRLINLMRRCRLVPLLGNHDQMLLDVRSGKYPISWLLDMGGTATLDSYSSSRDLDLIPDEHYAFLESCRDFYETDTHIFVHANYFPDIPMDEQHGGMLRWESLRHMTPGPHESGKTVIVGHTSQKNAEILDLGHLKCIDTYCYGGGWLTALDVQTGEIWQADREGNMKTH